MKYQKFIFSFIKYFCAFIFFITVFITILQYRVYKHTLELKNYAFNVKKHSLSAVYNYPINYDKRMSLVYEKMGISGQQFELQNSVQSFGSSGFIYLNISPEKSDTLIYKFDDIARDFIETFEEVSQSSYGLNDDLFSDSDFSAKDKPNYPKYPETDEGISQLLSDPLVELIEELWNGHTFQVAGVSRLNFDFFDRIKYFYFYFFKKDDFYEGLDLKNVISILLPQNIKDVINTYALDLKIKMLHQDKDLDLNYSQVEVTFSNTAALVDGLCSEKIDFRDFCSKFSLNRESFRSQLKKTLSVFKNSFTVRFNLFWSLKGLNLVFSNQKNDVVQILNGTPDANQPNLFEKVSSSGDDYLVTILDKQYYPQVSFLADMILFQNKFIYLIEKFRSKSEVLEAYFSTPTGFEIFNSTEEFINHFSGNCRIAALKISVDDEKLIPELRLYQPSRDILNKSQSMISSEMSEHVSDFTRSFISWVGGFQLDPALRFSQTPIIQNGKWIVSKGLIDLKNLGKYVQTSKPEFDIQL